MPLLLALQNLQFLAFFSISQRQHQPSASASRNAEPSTSRGSQPPIAYGEEGSDFDGNEIEMSANKIDDAYNLNDFQMNPDDSTNVNDIVRV